MEIPVRVSSSLWAVTVVGQLEEMLAALTEIRGALQAAQSMTMLVLTAPEEEALHLQTQDSLTWLLSLAIRQTIEKQHWHALENFTPFNF